MFVLAAAVAVTAAVITRLAIVLHDDRPSSAPRSHGHEMDTYSYPAL